jgi:O-succinylbenzoic acid--CoA ligase
MDPATALATVPDPNPRHPVDDARPATLLFTSGSMGFPRAVVHPLSAHLASAVGANPALDFVAGDRWLLSLPLYHVGGLAILFRTLQAGATVILPTPGQPLADAVLENAVTHLSLVPTQLERLLRSPDAVRLARTLKTLLLGGAPVRQQCQVLNPGRPHHFITDGPTEGKTCETKDFVCDGMCHAGLGGTGLDCG